MLNDQGYNDRDSVQGSLTARYEFAPQRDAVLLVRATRVDYLRELVGTPQRNSNDFVMLAGLDRSFHC